jgi:hypothetical protein
LHAAPEPAVSPAAKPDLPGVVVAFKGAPEGIAVTADGVVAVNVRDPDALVIFPISSDAAPSQRTTVPTAGEGRHLTLGGPNGPALLAEETTDDFLEIALPSGTVLSTTRVGRQPHEVFAVAGGVVFVADEFGNAFSLVKDGVLIRTVPAPLQPGGGAASADGRYAVGVGVRARRITEYTDTGEIVGSANCGAGPTHTATGNDGLFWVNDTLGGAILGFRLTAAGPKQVATIPVGAGSRPYGDAYDMARHTLWVTLTGYDQLLGLTFSGTHVVKRTVYDTVRQPNTVAVDPTTGELVVTGSEPDGQLQFISP